MKLRVSLSISISLYFFFLLVLYHYKIKTYYYWDYVAFLKDSSFNFSFIRVLIAVFLFVANMYFLRITDRKKLIFIVLSIFFLLLTIPSLIAFTSSNMYPVKLLFYHQTLFYSVYFFSKIKINFDRIPVLNKKLGLYLIFIVITIGIIPYLLIYGPHINLKNLVLIDVYRTRAIMENLSNPYFGYTYSLFTKILVPLLILFALELRNRLLVCAGVIYLLLFYLFGAHKTIYVALFVVFIFYRLNFYWAIKKIVTLSNILILLSIVLAAVGFDYLWIYSFRRVHFLPTLLDISYLDFFKDRPLYWSESIFKSFIDNPLEMNHANIIGKYYFNSPEMSANNGLVSDGFMNFGTFGVLINIFLISIYFMVLNSLRIPSKYFGLYLLVIFSFISSATTTVFLTHGAFFLLIISFFILNDKSSAVRSRV